MSIRIFAVVFQAVLWMISGYAYEIGEYWASGLWFYLGTTIKHDEVAASQEEKCAIQN